MARKTFACVFALVFISAAYVRTTSADQWVEDEASATNAASGLRGERRPLARSSSSSSSDPQRWVEDDARRAPEARSASPNAPILEDDVNFGASAHPLILTDDDRDAPPPRAPPLDDDGVEPEARDRALDARRAPWLNCDDLGATTPLPPTPPKTLSFFTLGDWGVRGLRGTDSRAVARAMLCSGKDPASLPRFVATLGDNFYQSGVRDVDDAQFKEKFEDVFETEPTFISPWYPALGDHDHRGSVAAQVEYGDRNGRWRMPSPYYARVERLKPAGVDANGADLGAGVTVQTIVVDWIGLEGKHASPGWRDGRRFGGDLNKNVAGYDAANAQWAWLERVLSDATADIGGGKAEKPTWRVVIGHRPLMSASERGKRDDAKYPAEAKTRRALRELLVKHGVDAWINGHDHTAQVAIRPARVAKRTRARGRVYVRGQLVSRFRRAPRQRDVIHHVLRG
ncbi:uncharacterized protein MICPUCDRAFT_57207 [Micromonas pusilla CCMP1545]|uniref:Predicted protein n=1 Tax=Micromonas pusilla (strain CCMP1545) TaxID=564608 RepID=C1MQ94_MICPC|nr:uncharacterized protein MICPUCDRAFT_57207 [Micromonas pusilla CCMP1545]EEH57668.1 predicted protein [Micromonas pusilla CCMP1545]|eukprot:XP_003057717.1 predicted protein [Micromonas pusilla CCMP1545]